MQPAIHQASAEIVADRNHSSGAKVTAAARYRQHSTRRVSFARRRRQLKWGRGIMIDSFVECHLKTQHRFF